MAITSPIANATFEQGSPIAITANANDTDGSISKVEFFNGNTKIAEDISSPYSFTWNGVTAGSYTITAKATDNQNANTTSEPINLTVNEANNTGCSNPEWSSTATYIGGNLVSYNGVNYRAKWWTQSNPETNSGQYGPWENIGPCSVALARKSLTMMG